VDSQVHRRLERNPLPEGFVDAAKIVSGDAVDPDGKQVAVEAWV
jgi:hypothetical protein